MTKEHKKDNPLWPDKSAAKKQDNKDIVAALDIGSSKICCFIAETTRADNIEIIGIGQQAARGIKAGKIVDLLAAEHAIGQAVDAAEKMARVRLGGRSIRAVVANIPGTQILSHHQNVETRVGGQEVGARELQNIMSHARSVAAHGRDDVIHAIPGSYTLDGQRGIADPKGMRGQTLSADLNIFTAYNTALGNVTRVAGRNHLDIEGFCVAPYASGLSALVEDEKDLGCTVIDMGGGTTSIAVFAEGKLVYGAAVPVGGQHVTNDIARGLTTSVADAERIKTLYGSVRPTPADDTAVIDVPPIGEDNPSQPNYVPKSALTGIIQPRIEETFELVRAKLVDNGIMERTGRRVVLTGGASQLQGLTDIAQFILDKQVRLGRPQNVRGLAEATGGPAFATCAGLLHYAAHHMDDMPAVTHNQLFGVTMPVAGAFLQKVTHWLKENW